MGRMSTRLAYSLLMSLSRSRWTDPSCLDPKIRYNQTEVPDSRLDVTMDYRVCFGQGRTQGGPQT